MRILISYHFNTFIKSITFGKGLTEVRKNKKMSQDEVSKLVGVHGAVIGRYEREEVKACLRSPGCISQTN